MEQSVLFNTETNYINWSSVIVCYLFSSLPFPTCILYMPYDSDASVTFFYRAMQDVIGIKGIGFEVTQA